MWEILATSKASVSINQKNTQDSGTIRAQRPLVRNRGDITINLLPDRGVIKITIIRNNRDAERNVDLREDEGVHAIYQVLVKTHLGNSYDNLMRAQFIISILLRRVLRHRELKIISKVKQTVKDRTRI